MNIKLLTEHHLEFLGLKEGYIGSSESTVARIPHCCKSHVAAHFVYVTISHTSSSCYQHMTVRHTCTS